MPTDPNSGSTTNSLDALREITLARRSKAGRPYEGGRKSEDVLRIRNASANATTILAEIQAAHSCTAAQALDHMAAGYKAAMAMIQRRSNMAAHEVIQTGRGISGATGNSPAHIRDLMGAAEADGTEVQP